jgi:hypothetical protein
MILPWITHGFDAGSSYSKTLASGRSLHATIYRIESPRSMATSLDQQMVRLLYSKEFSEMIKERHPLLGIREEVATKRLPSLL